MRFITGEIISKFNLNVNDYKLFRALLLRSDYSESKI